MLLIAAALFVRAIIPAGYMPSDETRSFSIMLCADQNAASVRIDIPVDSTSSHHDKNPSSSDHPCAFGGLSTASLGGADAVLLDSAIAHIIALGFSPVATPLLQGFFRLRPPLRGPPALS